MATGGNAIRGTRVGSGPMGEQDHGYHADRIAVSYWDGLGNETVRYFAAGLPEEEIPDTIDHPQTGLPAGRDKENPPALAKTEPAESKPLLLALEIGLLGRQFMLELTGEVIEEVVPAHAGTVVTGTDTGDTVFHRATPR